MTTQEKMLTPELKSNIVGSPVMKLLDNGEEENDVKTASMSQTS